MKDEVGNPDLAHVVEKGGPFQVLPDGSPGLESQATGDVQRVFRDAGGMAFGLPVSGVQGGDQGLQSAVVGLFEGLGHVQDLAVRPL